MSDEITSGTAEFGKFSIMQPTLHFRWDHRQLEGKVLQQAWKDISDGTVEWRDVPEAEEE